MYKVDADFYDLNGKPYSIIRYFKTNKDAKCYMEHIRKDKLFIGAILYYDIKYALYHQFDKD